MGYIEQDLERLRRKIMLAMYASTYDHRDFINPLIANAFPHLMETDQLTYSRFKYAVANVLQPKTIYEVGLGWGVSAEAFISGYPETKLFAIDNGSMGGHPNGQQLVSTAVLTVRRGGFEMKDSKDLPVFVHPEGPIDLIHIDGDHALEAKAADMVKAFEARPEWILVDDIHNAMVAAGTFAGIYMAAPDPPNFLMFENSHTGNLLIHVARRAPEYRGLAVQRT